MGDYRGMNDCRESDPPEVVETGSAAWRWVRTRSFSTLGPESGIIHVRRIAGGRACDPLAVRTQRNHNCGKGSRWACEFVVL